MSIIIALIALWLLCGLLATVIVRNHDDGINILLALIFTLAGPTSLLVIFILWASETEI